MSERTLSKYKEILRNDFAAFTHRAFLELRGARTYLYNWHLELLAEKFEDIRCGRNTRLIVNLPTRYLKSFIGSVAFPAFVLGHQPSAEILCISYGEEPAKQFATDFSNLMLSEFYKGLFDTRFESEEQAIGDLRTTAGGVRRSRSIYGAILSFGADYIIIDDPTKPVDAESQALRAKARDTFYSSIDKRLNDRKKGAIVVIMQRLHPEDLSASVQATEKWELVALPALAEADEDYSIRTPYGIRHVTRKRDEALHPERETADQLRHEREKHPYHFSAQYQQNPAPRDGGIIRPEWLRTYEDGQLPKFDRRIQSWDTANTDGEESSFNVCTTWGVEDRKFYLLHVFREQMGFDRLSSAALELAEQRAPTRIVVEAQATGAALLATLQAAGYPAEPAPPTSESKRARLEAKIDRFTFGSVLLPKDGIWLEDYVDELTRFPHCRFSDQVDSTVQALSLVEVSGGNSAESAIETMRLLGGDTGAERIRVRFPPGHGTLIGRDGHKVLIGPDGVAEINAEDFGTFNRAFPNLERL